MSTLFQLPPPRQTDDSWLSDCTSDYTEGTGDSGVILSSRRPTSGDYMEETTRDWTGDSAVVPSSPRPTSDCTSDYTGGTGDSGVILSSRRPLPPIPPKNTGPMYEKLQQSNRDKDSQYSNPYRLLKIERSHTPSPVQANEAMASKEEVGSSKQQKKSERMYENSLTVHTDTSHAHVQSP